MRVPTATLTQYWYLEELATGVKKGKDLRTRLRTRGWRANRITFYRTIRMLKDAGLIEARRIPRDPGEYRGAQCVYQLTEPGWDEVHVWRQYAEYMARRQREHREWCRRYSVSRGRGNSYRGDI